MHHQVTVIGQHPFGLVIPLDAERNLTAFFHAKGDFITNRLVLFRVRTSADHEKIGKRGDAGKVQYPDILGFLVFGSPDGSEPRRLNSLFGLFFDRFTLGWGLRCLLCRQKNLSARYRTIEMSVLFSFPTVTQRVAFLKFVLCSLLAVAAFGQTAPAASPATDADSKPKVAEIKADLNDPLVIRAQQNVDRIRGLVQQGVLPPANLLKAADDLNDALDSSILRSGAFTADLQPEQADQMVEVAERVYLRRQKRSMQLTQLVATGVMSRSEAEASVGDVTNAKIQLDLATERAHLVKDMAQQRALAQQEEDAEAHPEFNGSLYTHYDGSGVFTRDDFNKISSAFMMAFGKAIPVSADGQTKVHEALGFNHAGRIDIALNPEQREGVWLIHYLEAHRIPYYAFKAAIAHKATGPHIHLGPSSTRLTASTAKNSCCGGS